MLIVETIAKVRRAYFAHGKSIKAICRELGLSRKVVRKVIRSGETSFTYERTVQRRPKLGQWQHRRSRHSKFGFADAKCSRPNRTKRHKTNSVKSQTARESIPTGSVKIRSNKGYNSFMCAIVAPEEESYSYAGTGYANPHAVTQIANGLSTTTYSYDQNGNLVQKTTDGVTTTYLWDYANRLIALGSGGATTTYGYDAFGARVFQSTATTTTLYPFKWYSVASSTGSGATFATTTEHIWTPQSDTLVATVDQQFASGVATGSARTFYMHPDHLGSPNVVTDASGTVVQTLDYYPFGAQRINTGTANPKRQYIGQFFDESNLMYFNARYYNPNQGQFISQDPIFQQLGSGQAEKLANLPLQEILKDPQSLNSYSYAKNNPISIKDPSELLNSKTATILGLYAQVLNLLSQMVVQLGGGGSANPRSASTALFAQSTTIEPKCPS